jgi:site-specific recombinase XerD
MGALVSKLRLVDGATLTPELRTVAIGRRQAPGRKSNEEHGRTREYLSDAEVEKLMGAAELSSGRNQHRDATLILLCYRHGLRVSELVALRWSQVDLKGARLHVQRIKNGIAGVHPLTGRELRALRKLHREQPTGTEHLFMSERGAPMATAAAQKVVRVAGERAGVGFPIHIHMLRHSCGYALINKGTDVRTVQAYLGHASISNTVIYTQLDATRFSRLWHD